jgi:hypothetical protein
LSEAAAEELVEKWLQKMLDKDDQIACFAILSLAVSVLTDQIKPGQLFLSLGEKQTNVIKNTDTAL